MNTIHQRVAELDTMWVKMKDEDQYRDFVRMWRQVHDDLIPMILEHKSKDSKYSKQAAHHQSILAKYSNCARWMYGLRATGKERMKNGEILRTFQKKKITEPA